MKPAKFLFFCLPAFIFLFMETLIRGTFYAFGYQGDTGFLTVTLPSVLALLFAAASVHNLGDKSKYAFIILIGIDMAGLYTQTDGITGPLLALISAVCVSAVSFLILQMAGFAEVFILGTALLGIDLLTAGQAVVNYIILYMIASVGIYLAIFYVNITCDARIRSGSRNMKGYKGIMLALFLLMSVFMIYGYDHSGAKMRIAPGENEFLKTLVNKFAFTTISGKDPYTGYWGKLDDFELQGEISVKDGLIMSVKTSHPGYLRAESADYYTGRGWKNSLILRQVNQRDYAEGMEGRGKKKINQEITLAPDFRTGIIFSIGHPTGLDVSQGDLATDGGGNYYIYNAPSGLAYQVSSVVTEAEGLALEGDLGQESDFDQNSDQYPADIRTLYLQLPDGIPGRVKTLAVSLTKDAGNHYEKVKQIESYLKNNYQYDLKISSPPPGRDVTDYFLFDLKRGYCTYHSTAMVVMLRSIGIPARWVKGFTPGTYNADKDAYEISLADAHSWVEVYFPQYGWITLEPTPGFDPEISNGAKDETDYPVQKSKKGAESSAAVSGAVSKRENKPEDQAQNKTENQSKTKRIDIKVMNLVMLFISILVVVSAGLIRLRRMMTGSGDENQRIELIFRSFENTMEKRGFIRLPAQTPLEYAGILKGEFEGVAPEICRITEIYMNWKYGGKNIEAEELREAELILKRIRDNI